MIRRAAACVLVAFLAGCSSEKPVEQKKAEKPPETYRVKFTTTKGDIVVEAHRDWAPYGSDRFYELVQAKYFDGAKFFRVMKKFIAQFGINKDPKVSELWRQMRLPDDPVKQKNARGTLSFARLGPASRTTQIFINLKDNSALLDKDGFAPFAKIVEGLDVADQLTFLYGDVAPRGAGPDPNKIEMQGNTYLERDYPRLDGIVTARVMP